MLKKNISPAQSSENAKIRNLNKEIRLFNATKGEERMVHLSKIRKLEKKYGKQAIPSGE